MVPKSLKIGLCPRSYHNSATLFNHRAFSFRRDIKWFRICRILADQVEAGRSMSVTNVSKTWPRSKWRRALAEAPIARPVQHWLQRHQAGRRSRTTDEQALLGPVMKPLASNDSKNQNYETWVGNNYIVNLENRVYLSELPFCKPPMYRKCTGRTGRELLKIYWLEINLEVDRKKVKSLSVPVQ
jgi:hypothetical protein